MPGRLQDDMLRDLNIPNTLTLGRIFVVPLIVALLYFPGRLTCLLATLLFMLASLTDFLDGYIARYFGQVTNSGKFLDPLADKLLTTAMLVMLVKLGWAPAWVVIIIISRELFITGLRGIASDMGIVIAADKWGKLKTVVMGFALLPLALHYPVFGYNLNPVGEFLLYITLGLAVFSGCNYVYRFYQAQNTPKVKE